MRQVRVIQGPFAGQQAELLEQLSDRVRLRLQVFGRAVDWELPLSEVEELGSDSEALERLRGRMREDAEQGWLHEEQVFWMERATLPEEEPLLEHSAWQEDLRLRRARVQAEEAERMALFEAEVATASAPGAALESLRARLLPEAERRADLKARWRAAPDLAEAYSARSEQAWHRRRRAEEAADDAAYAAWMEEVDPAAQRQLREEAARRRVEAQRPRIVERVRRDWGLELPEGFFRFLTLWEGLGAEARGAAQDLGLHPMGISDLLRDPEAPALDGLDPRLHGRYYRDPPEFLTFLHGGSDGLHYGLWFDEPGRCAGICHYYNNDGIDLSPPQGSPLSPLRSAALEALARPAEAAARWPLRRLLESIGPEEVEPVAPVPRLQTLDGAGAIGLPGEQPPEPRTWAEQEERRQHLQGPELQPLVEEALQACASGQPSAALVLGRDLHWLGRPEAGPLLVAAWTALGRPALAGIAAVHHAHRELLGVGVLRLS
jgi:hypothetical protein